MNQPKLEHGNDQTGGSQAAPRVGALRISLSENLTNQWIRHRSSPAENLSHRKSRLTLWAHVMVRAVCVARSCGPVVGERLERERLPGDAQIGRVFAGSARWDEAPTQVWTGAPAFWGQRRLRIVKNGGIHI